MSLPPTHTPSFISLSLTHTHTLSLSLTYHTYLHAQAVVAEANARMTEMKKAAYEFDRDVVRAAVNAVSKESILTNDVYSVAVCQCIIVLLYPFSHSILARSTVRR